MVKASTVLTHQYYCLLSRVIVVIATVHHTVNIPFLSHSIQCSSGQARRSEMFGFASKFHLGGACPLTLDVPLISEFEANRTPCVLSNRKSGMRITQSSTTMASRHAPSHHLFVGGSNGKISSFFAKTTIANRQTTS